LTRQKPQRGFDTPLLGLGLLGLACLRFVVFEGLAILVAFSFGALAMAMGFDCFEGASVLWAVGCKGGLGALRGFVATGAAGVFSALMGLEVPKGGLETAGLA
jgi:hypothetical protein